jgi:hypothetical protein
MLGRDPDRDRRESNPYQMTPPASEDRLTGALRQSVGHLDLSPLAPAWRGPCPDSIPGQQSSSCESATAARRRRRNQGPRLSYSTTSSTERRCRCAKQPRQRAQTYLVDLGASRVEADETVTLAYTYRTITDMYDGLLQLRVDQPSHGLTLSLDYGDTDIPVFACSTSSPAAGPLESPAHRSLSRVTTIGFPGGPSPRAESPSYGTHTVRSQPLMPATQG